MKIGCKFILFNALMLAVMLSGCRGVEQKGQVMGPEAVAEAFYRAVAAGDMEQAEALCDTVSMKGYLDAWKASWSELAEKDSCALRIAGGILSESAFTVVNVEKEGDRRSVTYTLEADGQNKSRKAVLKKEEGEWRVERMTDVQ